MDVESLSLEDLLNAPTHVASQRAETVRETPGVVTVITREEIQAVGARDLIDVLLLVPGFAPPAVDVEGVIDMGFRGIWGHEGKILLMVDGEPMNEMLYDDNALGFHYPVDSIERVEIIRGPGSALYGGWAELAVIDVITRDASQIHGAAGSAFYSERISQGPLSAATLGARSLHLSVGQQSVFGVAGLDATFEGMVGEGTRSSGTYNDFAGNSYDMAAPSANGALNSQLDPLFLNLSLKFHDLKLRLLVDDYRFYERDSYGTDTGATTGTAALQKWFTLIADASYAFKVGKLEVTPRLTYKYQLPWQVRDATSPDYLDTSVNRYTARVTAAYDFTESLRAMAGAEDYVEKAWLNHPENATVASQGLFPGGTCADGTTGGSCATEVSYLNVALFAEGQWRSFLGNLTAGARYEHHSAFGSSFVPRVALTKVIDAFHFKLLFSTAFRAPGIEDIALSAPGQPVTPERTRVVELEAGRQFSERFFLSANLFDINIDHPIVYYYDPATQTDYYKNFPRTGSYGVEVDARLRYPWGSFSASYSYYGAYSRFAAVIPNEAYGVPGTPGQFIASPTHKLVLYGKVSLSDHLFLAPSLVYFSERSGPTSVDADGNAVITQLPPVVLANLFLTFDKVGVAGAQVGLGIYNAFDTQWSYLQGYNSTHPPIPAPGREVALKLSYTPP